MSYEVKILPNAKRTLRKLEHGMQVRIASAIFELGDNPRPHECIALKGEEACYRIRVSDYRVLYSIDDGIKVIAVYRIANRKDAYK